jgi:hypothetical protein
MFVTIFEGVMCLVSDPWGAPGVRSLLSGKMELQQQVLELVSAEGVDLVLLRIGRDKKHHCAIAVELFLTLCCRSALIFVGWIRM